MVKKEDETYTNDSPKVNVEIHEEDGVTVSTNVAPLSAIIMLSAAIEAIATGQAQELKKTAVAEPVTQ